MKCKPLQKTYKKIVSFFCTLSGKKVQKKSCYKICVDFIAVTALSIEKLDVL